MVFLLSKIFLDNISLGNYYKVIHSEFGMLDNYVQDQHHIHSNRRDLMDDHIKLINIIEQMEKMEQNIENLVYVEGAENTQDAKEFRDFLRELQREMLLTPNARYASNLYELLLLLKRPIGEWGFFNNSFLEDQKIDLNLRILSESTGITKEAHYLLREYESYDELATSPIREFMILCRGDKDNSGDPEAQKRYELFRNYIIDHPLVNMEETQVWVIKNLGNKERYLKIIQDCYQPFQIHRYRFACPHCKWTLEEKVDRQRGNQYYCLSEDCENEFDESMMLSNPIPKEITHRLHPRIQRTTVIPGLKEMELKLMLEKKKLKVLMYPNIERNGDIEIRSKDNHLIYVDVKDYKYPTALGARIISDLKKGLLKTDIIAIPNQKATKGYLKRVRSYLSEQPGLEPIRILSFKDVVKLTVEMSEKDA